MLCKSCGEEINDQLDCYLKLPEELFLRKPDTTINDPSDPLSKVPVEHIEISEDGIQTYLEGHTVYLKGYPHRLHVVRLVILKKCLLTALRVIKGILRPWSLKSTFFVNIARLIDSTIGEYFFHPTFYQITGQELLNKWLELDPIVDTDTHFTLGMGIVYAWEYDKAYRLPSQVFITNLNQGELKKHPRRELKRCLDDLIKRENSETMKDKWRTVRFALNFVPIKKIAKYLASLDQSKFTLDDNDLYWKDGLIYKRDFDYET